jgi:cardiolipin synthase
MPFEWELPTDATTLAVGALIIAFAIYSGGHALLHKTEPRSALGWLVACLGWPILGALAYWVFGRNRIERRGRKLRERFPRAAVDVRQTLPDGLRPGEFAELARVSQAVTGRPLVEGNRVEPLRCGDEAYPAMLEAIRGATRRVRLLSYIFDNDRVGREFAQALADATARGIDV